MDKYAIYLRKSRADLELEAIGKFETLRLHEERLTALAESRQLVVSEIFRELVSGDSIASRPEMQRLLEKVRAGVFRGVLVTEVSRLARGDGIDQGTVSQAFRESGTLIITPEKVYDPTSPLDEDFFDFSLFMARQEYKFIRRRMVAGKEQLKDQGCWVMPDPPFGYKKVWHSLEPVEPEASLVRKIFEGWISGKTTYSMFLDARAEGFDISFPLVKKILRNPAYIGILRRKNHPDVRGNWPPLISEDLFAQAGALFTHPKTPRGKTTRNPLAGLLRCSCCGRCMEFQKFKTTVYFRHGLPNDCRASNAKVAPVLDALSDALKEVLKEDSVVLESVPGPDLDRLNARLSSLKSQLSRAYEAYESGVYSLEEFASRREDLQNQIRTQEAAIDAAGDEIDQAEKKDALRMSVSEALADLKSWNADPAALNLFLKSFIQEIRYTRPDRSEPVELEVVFRD